MCTSAFQGEARKMFCAPEAGRLPQPSWVLQTFAVRLRQIALAIVEILLSILLFSRQPMIERQRQLRTHRLQLRVEPGKAPDDKSANRNPLTLHVPFRKLLPRPRAHHRSRAPRSWLLGPGRTRSGLSGSILKNRLRRRFQRQGMRMQALKPLKLGQGKMLC